MIHGVAVLPQELEPCRQMIELCTEEWRRQCVRPEQAEEKEQRGSARMRHIGHCEAQMACAASMLEVLVCCA